MMCDLSQMQGVIYLELMPAQKTITAEVYCQQLERLRTALSDEFPVQVNRKGVLTNGHNAWIHAPVGKYSNFLKKKVTGPCTHRSWCVSQSPKQFWREDTAKRAANSGHDSFRTNPELSSGTGLKNWWIRGTVRKRFLRWWWLNIVFQVILFLSLNVRRKKKKRWPKSGLPFFFKKYYAFRHEKCNYVNQNYFLYISLKYQLVKIIKDRYRKFCYCFKWGVLRAKWTSCTIL